MSDSEASEPGDGIWRRFVPKEFLFLRCCVTLRSRTPHTEISVQLKVVLFLFSIPPTIQDPAAHAGLPPVQRVFKKHQTDRYAVVTDSEGPSGKVHLEYVLRFFAERPVAESTDTKVAVTFLDLKASYNGMDAPPRKAFGVASYQFSTAGFPLDYSLAGEQSVFVVPILSWYLPTGAVNQSLEFTVPDLVFDKTIHASGKGSIVKSEPKTVTIKLNLTFTFADKPLKADEKAPAFNSNATFDLTSGALLRSEGQMINPSGSMTFHLRKL